MTAQESLKARRDGALDALVRSVPYIQFLGVTFDRRGDELTATLSYNARLIGNPVLPALHGGVTAGFLEITALVELAWHCTRAALEDGRPQAEDIAAGGAFHIPKTIDLTVDYLRPCRPQDCYARAQINRSGRRYASVHVEAWQDNRTRLFAQATGHFLMPPRPPDG
ncbi:MAG: PaaI family thioesterase [Rhodobacteraceae bacterium]|nr:PaaI family thioesterase [Paracoccaceae bacterium]